MVGKPIVVRYQSRLEKEGESITISAANGSNLVPDLR
jgi:hypothetical protein